MHAREEEPPVFMTPLGIDGLFGIGFLLFLPSSPLPVSRVGAERTLPAMTRSPSDLGALEKVGRLERRGARSDGVGKGRLLRKGGIADDGEPVRAQGVKVTLGRLDFTRKHLRVRGHLASLHAPQLDIRAYH